MRDMNGVVKFLQLSFVFPICLPNLLHCFSSCVLPEKEGLQSIIEQEKMQKANFPQLLLENVMERLSKPHESNKKFSRG